MDLEAHIRREWATSSQLPIENISTEDVATFGVVSYNILADCHMRPDDWPYCPQSSRRSEDRHAQLMVELKHEMDSTDIICLQEVGSQYFLLHLQPALLKEGFTGSFFSRLRGIDEGEATFFRSQRFNLLEEKNISCAELIKEAAGRAGLSYEVTEKMSLRVDMSDVVIFSKFFDIKTKRVISVCNLHAIFGGYKAIDVASLQIISSLNCLVEFAGGFNESMILCGDFNMEPHFPGYQVIRDGELNQESIQFLKRHPLYGAEDSGASGKTQQYLVDIAKPLFQHQCTTMKSAYAEILGQEPPFTTHDDIMGLLWPATRGDHPPKEIPKNDSGIYQSNPDEFGTQPFKGTLDYQWFNTASLCCQRVLRTVDESVIERFHSLPNQVFPSDHLQLKASYSFL